MKTNGNQPTFQLLCPSPLFALGTGLVRPTHELTKGISTEFRNRPF